MDKESQKTMKGNHNSGCLADKEVNCLCTRCAKDNLSCCTRHFGDTCVWQHGNKCPDFEPEMEAPKEETNE